MSYSLAEADDAMMRNVIWRIILLLVALTIVASLLLVTVRSWR